MSVMSSQMKSSEYRMKSRKSMPRSGPTGVVLPAPMLLMSSFVPPMNDSTLPRGAASATMRCAMSPPQIGRSAAALMPSVPVELVLTAVSPMTQPQRPTRKTTHAATMPATALLLKKVEKAQPKEVMAQP